MYKRQDSPLGRAGRVYGLVCQERHCLAYAGQQRSFPRQGALYTQIKGNVPVVCTLYFFQQCFFQQRVVPVSYTHLDVYKRQHVDAERLSMEMDFTSNVTIFTSDTVVTDWSGIAYEFSLSLIHI